MSRRLDFNRDFRNRQARYGVSVKDEIEWMKKMQRRSGCKRMKTMHRGKATIVGQINKLRLLERNHLAENV